MRQIDEPPVSRDWNYHPELPLQDPSIFRWPPNPGFLARWFARNWLTLSERVMMVLIAVALWAFAYPPLEAATSFAFGWIAQVWAINMAIMIAVAGGLHWYFYMRRGQGKKLKFDHRDQARGNKLWDFSNQVHDNMFWSLTSGVAQLSGFQVLTMWLMANGYAPTITFAQNPVWFVLALILLPIWSAFHFYWVHRLLHVPVLYRFVHSLHHRNVSIGPWSGFSMHPVEHFLYLSSLAIHWVVASHPIHLIFHVI
ncbi:MAG: sterol desaturase family protein, partial [Albidovulum sp.]